jgi:hypothetical protein
MSSVGFPMVLNLVFQLSNILFKFGTKSEKPI